MKVEFKLASKTAKNDSLNKTMATSHDCDFSEHISSVIDLNNITCSVPPD